VRICIIDYLCVVDLQFQRSTSCFTSVSTITDVKFLLTSVFTTIRTTCAQSVDPTFGSQEQTTNINLQSELRATALVAIVQLSFTKVASTFSLFFFSGGIIDFHFSSVLCFASAFGRDDFSGRYVPSII
jgi:hypothetical protein